MVITREKEKEMRIILALNLIYSILTGHAHLALVPGACIVSLVLAFNALSNAFARHSAQR